MILQMPRTAFPQANEADARELLDLLSELREGLRRLDDIASEKLTALRKADCAALLKCAEQEGQALERVGKRDRQRSALLARLAQRMPGASKPQPRLSEIADSFPEPFASQIRSQALGLRELALSLQKKNGLVAAVARGLHNTVRSIFEDVSRVNQESIGYGPDGRDERRDARSWIDAVG